MELLTLQKLEDNVSPTNNNLTSSATATSLRNSLSSNSNNLNNNGGSNGTAAGGAGPETKERMVQVTRQKMGGLGLSIKGGAEHKLPILISRFVTIFFSRPETVPSVQ